MICRSELECRFNAIYTILATVFMKIKTTVVEILQDNYQGGSGLPVKRELMVEIPNDIIAVNVYDSVYTRVKEKRLNKMWGNALKNTPYISIISIEILPEA